MSTCLRHWSRVNPCLGRILVFYRVLCAFNPWPIIFLCWEDEVVLVMKMTTMKHVNQISEKVPKQVSQVITACTEDKAFRPFFFYYSHKVVWEGHSKWITWVWGSTKRREPGRDTNLAELILQGLFTLTGSLPKWDAGEPFHSWISCSLRILCNFGQVI